MMIYVSEKMIDDKVENPEAKESKESSFAKIEDLGRKVLALNQGFNFILKSAEDRIEIFKYDFKTGKETMFRVAHNGSYKVRYKGKLHKFETEEKIMDYIKSIISLKNL